MRMSGRIWLGSSLNGIDVIDKNITKFDHYYKSSLGGASMSNDIVRAFYEEEDGNLWIATDGGGLNFLIENEKLHRLMSMTRVTHRSIRSNAVLTICEVKGILWVGTWQGGINVLDRKTKTFRQIDPDNPNLRSVFYLTKDSEGNVWASTYGGGISKIDTKTEQVRTYLNDPTNPKHKQQYYTRYTGG